MSYYPEFANFIENHLAKEDRSASWLASRLKVDSSTVGRWLNDGTRPGSAETVARIADILLIEKAALLIAAGYGYQDAPDVKNQTTVNHQSDSSTKDITQKRGGGDINFHSSAEVHGDVFSADTVNKTHHSDGTVTRQETQEDTHK